jgi:hypothetical protein
MALLVLSLRSLFSSESFSSEYMRTDDDTGDASASADEEILAKPEPEDSTKYQLT